VSSRSVFFSDVVARFGLERASLFLVRRGLEGKSRRIDPIHRKHGILEFSNSKEGIRCGELYLVGRTCRSSIIPDTGPARGSFAARRRGKEGSAKKEGLDIGGETHDWISREARNRVRGSGEKTCLSLRDAKTTVLIARSLLR
jgi:hypothetical protein